VSPRSHLKSGMVKLILPFFVDEARIILLYAFNFILIYIHTASVSVATSQIPLL